MKQVSVLVGAGSIGQAIIRRVSAGKHIVLADYSIATTPVDKLLELPFLKEINDTLKAYQYSKRCNVLRVMFEATRWGVVVLPLTQSHQVSSSHHWQMMNCMARARMVT